MGVRTTRVEFVARAPYAASTQIFITKLLNGNKISYKSNALNDIWN